MKRAKDRVLFSQLKRAAEIWPEIASSPEPADRWLGNFFHRHRRVYGSRDRRFLAETLYALFRHKLLLQAWAEHLEAKEDPILVVVLAAVSEGLLPFESFKEDIPGFFPGRNLPENIYYPLRNHRLPEGLQFETPEDELAVRFSFPLWLVRRWKDRFGFEECKTLLASLVERPPLTVRINPIKMTRERQIERFKKYGWEASPTSRSPYGLVLKERVNLFDTEDFRKGFFEVQDEGSQIVCRMLDPQPGEILWDVCAGGGGKSLLLAAMMENRGRIIATDLRPRKLEELKKRFRRAGIMNIFPADLNRVGEIREVKKGVDKILVDAPCSGTGTIRRNPDLKWKLSPEKFSVNHRDQIAIVEKSLPFLKKGGRLYYVTCSLEPEENEDVMREIFSRHPELRQVSYPYSRDGFFRLTPHKNGTDGFFTGTAEKI